MSAAPGACDILVVGKDPAALIAALDCARLGLSVEAWIVDLDLSTAEDEVETAEPVITPDVFSHRGGIVAGILDELGVPYEIEKPEPGQEELCGIPASPLSLFVRKKLGTAGAMRVYMDRIKPVLSIGNENNLNKLVTSRMGTKVRDQLVNPRLRELYNHTAEELTVDAVAPGLAQAMTRGGSLSTGVIEMMVSDERVVQSVVVPGGLPAIMDALTAKLEYFAATVIHVAEPELEIDREDAKPGFHARAEIAGELLIDLDCAAILYDPEVLAVSPEVDFDRVGRVGYSLKTPGLESASAASVAQAVHVRRAVLSDPENPPIGLSGFEG